MDEFAGNTVVENESWFSRLGSSIKSVGIGILLFLVSFAVLGWNEWRAVVTARDIAEVEAICITVPSDAVDPANNEKVIHTTGTATPEGTLADEEFGVSAEAIRLRRTTEMYQWVEEKETKSKKKLGGGKTKETTYSYETQWVDHVVNSSEFHQTDGHQNPTSMPFESAGWDSDNVKLGAFQLSPGLVGRIGAWKPLKLDEDYLATAPAAAKDASLSNTGELYFGAAPGTPQVGDVRVSFASVPATEVSLISQQSGESFQPYLTSRGNAFEKLTIGNVSMPMMFQQARDANNMMTWILRLVGFVLMAVGIGMVLQPLAVLGDVVPFVGGLVGVGIFIFATLVALSLSLVTIAIAWIFVRPLVGIGLLVGAVAIFFVARQLRAKKGGAEPSVAS